MKRLEFPASVKEKALSLNFKKYDGVVCCEICKKILKPVDVRYDHIIPCNKGGNNTIKNCQILCEKCNGKKSDDEQKEEFLRMMYESTEQVGKTSKSFDKSSITKTEFDNIVRKYINDTGNIRKKDFMYVNGVLPSYSYVKMYYGNLSNLKKYFGIFDTSSGWNQETIKNALCSYIEIHGDILQKDLTKENGLPSLPCIRAKFPELKSFDEIKRTLCGLNATKTHWNKKKCIIAGKNFLLTHITLTQNDCTKENDMPPYKTILHWFGSMEEYKKALGIIPYTKNKYVSIEDIEKAIEVYFGNAERVVKSRKEFFKNFQYSESTIVKKYQSFQNFCTENNIIVIKQKKAHYMRDEVDYKIKEWFKSGNTFIPNGKDLTKYGLPSIMAIEQYYPDGWKTAFVYWQNIINISNT